MWSGNANNNESCMMVEKSSHSIRVDPGTGTGADNSRKIQVSISFTSCKAIDGA